MGNQKNFKVAVLGLILLSVALTGCNGENDEGGANGIISVEKSGLRAGLNDDPFDDGTGSSSGSGSGGGTGSSSGPKFACPALAAAIDEPNPFENDGITPKQCYQCAAATCGASDNPMSCFESTCRACKEAKAGAPADESIVKACASCAWKKLFDPSGFASDPNCNGY